MTAPPGVDPQLSDTLRATLDAMERLLNLFRIERILHLAVGVFAFLMLIYGVILVVRKEGADTTLLVSLFGSSGLITISSARITYFFNKAFTLVADVIRQLVKTGAGA